MHCWTGEASFYPRAEKTDTWKNRLLRKAGAARLGSKFIFAASNLIAPGGV